MNRLRISKEQEMDNLFVGLRLVTNEVKGFLLQKKLENNISNDVMCIVIKEALTEFEQGAAYDYARVIAQYEEAERAKDAEKTEETKEG